MELAFTRVDSNAHIFFAKILINTGFFEKKMRVHAATVITNFITNSFLRNLDLNFFRKLV